MTVPPPWLLPPLPEPLPEAEKSSRAVTEPGAADHIGLLPDGGDGAVAGDHIHPVQAVHALPVDAEVGA